MKNVVIICGHPDLKISLANKTILEEISALCPQAEIRKLCELYPDYQFDIKAEQAALEKADIIVFQYPMNWYGVPGLLKLYIDKVMEHGWAYGSQGTALSGKAFIISLTTGVPEAGFSAQGFVGHTVEELTFPVAKFAEMAKMDCKKIFYSCGMMCIPGVTTDEQKAALVDKAKKHAADIVECIKAL
ncbi:MAG: NAD(P)H-dependent oxidoreductase [Selenomonadaceae bacterium]|nr:NAD(P)H-dependent oxidoreductase [Selenomonadaceae bacterium]